MRILSASTGTVYSPVFVGADGETPTDASSTPTISIVRADGTAVTAPSVVSLGAGTGRYSAALSSTVTATLDVLTVTWTGTVAGIVQSATDRVEVVGGFYASLPELRAMKGLDDIDRFPGAALVEARQEFEDTAEQYLGVAYVPRYAVEAFHVTDYRAPILLGHQRVRQIRSMTVNGTAYLDAWTFAEMSGLLTLGFQTHSYYASSYQPQTLVVGYEYGYDRPPDALRRACREYVRSTVLRAQAGTTRDVIQQVMGDGTSNRYSTPDWKAGRPTGWLDVDRLLNSVPMEHVPGIA